MGKQPWPPSDGAAHVQSEQFGLMVLEITSKLAEKYPRMDFSDAAAHVFSWFDRRLAEDPTFINSRRFAGLSAFKAYLRQAIWNAGRLAERERKRRERIEQLPVDEAISTREVSAEEQAILKEAVEKLDEPHRTVFVEVFFHEREFEDIVNIYGGRFTKDQLRAIYQEAVDLLAELVAPEEVAARS